MGIGVWRLLLCKGTTGGNRTREIWGQEGWGKPQWKGVKRNDKLNSRQTPRWYYESDYVSKASIGRHLIKDREMALELQDGWRFKVRDYESAGEKRLDTSGSGMYVGRVTGTDRSSQENIFKGWNQEWVLNLLGNHWTSMRQTYVWKVGLSWVLLLWFLPKWA